jgi:sugar phosphate isomerase/epimerase
MNKFSEKLAVCSWSLQPESPAALLAQLNTIGIRKLQCALDPVRENPSVWGSIQRDCATAGIEIVSGMFGTLGEDYSTLDSIRRTGGVVPDSTWPENWKNIQRIAEIAQEMNLRLVTFHAGFLPHEPSDPDFKKLLQRINQIGELFSKRGIELGFETGQEEATTLKTFLDILKQPSVGVNFDPANMILYDKGDPIAALRTLSPYLKQCHIKDGIRTMVPGQWGAEVPAGTGEVDWRAFFATLREIGFEGYCSIEREAGNQRVEDIRTAKTFVEGLGV